MTKDKKAEIDVLDSTFDELATALNAGEDVRMSTRSVVLITRSYLRGWKEQEGVTWRKVNGGYFFTPDGIASLMSSKYPDESQALLDKCRGGKQ